MSKKQIVRIAGIASAVIFAMGALFPFVSMEFFGTKMSKSLINTLDGIFFILDAVLFAVTMFLSEKISLYICACRYPHHCRYTVVLWQQYCRAVRRSYKGIRILLR